MKELSKNVILSNPSYNFFFRWWKEIWNFRELLFALVTRDLKLRYRYAILGLLWVLIQPVFTMVLMKIIFSGHYSHEGIEYMVYVFSGMIVWQWFSSSILIASQSLITDAKLVQKIYFPRVVIPFAAVLSAFVDFLISLIFLFLLCWLRNINLSINEIGFICTLIVLLVINLCVAGAFAYLSSIFKDFRYMLPFLAQIGFFLTPIVYELRNVPEKFQVIIASSPFFLPLECFRASIFKDYAFPLLNWGGIVTVVLLVSVSFAVFQRFEFFIAEKM